MAPFERDPADWLRRFSPGEWIRAALVELDKAEKAWKGGDARAGAAGVKRAAGMALNAALIVEPRDSWGRSYVEHLQALSIDEGVPEAVRAACRVVLEARGPSHDVVSLRTPQSHARAVDAAKDVIAHAWSVAVKHDQELT